MPVRIICFDCDSTLSAIEGVDELARVRGPEVFAEVEAMTNAAMEGKIAVESVFKRRLEIIRPTREQARAIGQRYIENVEPTARATIRELRARGWIPVIVSGGFRPAIFPLAEYLGIERVEAVDLFFDAAGNYDGFDAAFPTTRSGGKPEVVQALRRVTGASEIVLIGDGASDLEAKPFVEKFFGFGRYVERAPVRKGSDLYLYALSDLLLHLP